MYNRKQVGQLGECMALEHMERHGYQLVTRNYRYEHGEIDLIVLKERLLVFVEVKTRVDSRFGPPEQSLSYRQSLKIRDTADEYLRESGWPFNIRFDVVAVLLTNPPEVEHFQDAY